MMNREERKEVLTLLDHLFAQWEDRPEYISMLAAQEPIENDFFEDLYEILYEFSYIESKLLARVWKLMDQKTAQLTDKNEENRYN